MFVGFWFTTLFFKANLNNFRSTRYTSGSRVKHNHSTTVEIEQDAEKKLSSVNQVGSRFSANLDHRQITKLRLQRVHLQHRFTKRQKNSHC